MVNHVDDVLKHAETVVIGNKDPDFQTVPERLREDQMLVDFVRISHQRSNHGQYDGLCW